MSDRLQVPNFHQEVVLSEKSPGATPGILKHSSCSPAQRFSTLPLLELHGHPVSANVIARSGLANALSRICTPLYDREPLRWRVWLTEKRREAKVWIFTCCRGSDD